MDDLSDSWTARPIVGARVGAVEYVLRDLTDTIGAGMVRVGERLPSESALAARYGVSRTVVREVLRICEARGLTYTRSGRGTFVAAKEPGPGLSFGEYSAAHLMEARPHIEIAAAGLAAIRRSEKQIEDLHALFERMEAEKDPTAWVLLDIELHRAMAAASGNPVFSEVLNRISGALARQSSILNLSPGRRVRADAEHRGIIAAIARGSVTEAEDAMEFHLDQVKEALATVPREGGVLDES